MKTKKNTPRYNWDSYFDDDIGFARAILCWILGIALIITTITIALAGSGLVMIIARSVIGIVIVGGFTAIMWPDRLERDEI